MIGRAGRFKAGQSVGQGRFQSVPGRVAGGPVVQPPAWSGRPYSGKRRSRPLQWNLRTLLTDVTPLIVEVALVRIWRGAGRG
jgi:hypothetical protein